MGESYYLILSSILSTRKDHKTTQRYPDVPTTSWGIFIQSMDSRTIDQSAGGKLRDLNAEESCALLEDLALYDNESWNDPRDFTKPVKAIALPQDVPSTSDHRLIELENHVQRLMEAHLALTQPTLVNKITTPCEICSGPHDTQYYMENTEQAFVEYASSRTDEAGGKWYTFKPEQNNLGDTYNPSWRSHPNLRWRQPQNSQNKFSNPPNRFQPNGSIPNRSFNNRPQNFNNQSNIEGLVFEFMASQDARLSKFEADFKQQQSEMTNKIDTVLKAITDRIAGVLPSNTVKNPKLGTHLVSSARSYTTIDPQCSSHPSNSINAIKAHFKEATISQTILRQHKIETKDPKTPLLVGRGFLATANVVIDCRMAKIAVGEGITRPVYIMDDLVQDFFIRPEGDTFDLDVYESYTNLFTIKCHYYGKFNDGPKKEYIEGETCFVDLVNRDQFTDVVLNTVINSLGYEMEDEVLYWYKIPLKSLDVGLKYLVSESDYRRSLGYVEKHKVMDVYVEIVEKNEESESGSNSASESDNDFEDEEHVVQEVKVNMGDFNFQVEDASTSTDGNMIPVAPKVNLTEDNIEVLDFDSLESDLEDVPENDRRDVAKDLIRTHAVESRRNLHFLRNDPIRIRVVCNGVVPCKNVVTYKVPGPNVDNAVNGKIVNEDASRLTPEK
ncbi:hypothetical protein Tco_0335341 [Tanacetum coccineum]